MPYCFLGSSIKYQGHTGWKTNDLNSIWVSLLGRSQLSNPSDLPCLSTVSILFSQICTVVTITQWLKSNINQSFKCATDNPYLTLTGELWCVCWENLGKNWLCHNSTTSYLLWTFAQWPACCCSGGEVSMPCCVQVEKSLCSSIHTLLSPFLVHCDLRDVCQLLPILAVYVGHYADMDTFHRSLVDRYGGHN